MTFILLSAPVLAYADKHEESSPIKKAEELLNNGNTSESLKIISGYRPEPHELFSYYYVSAKALKKAKKLSDSIDKFRMAYIYAASEEEKESALFQRADTYYELGFYNEAIVAFKIFLKNFGKTINSEKAELRLAESLLKIGNFREALQHCEMAGSSSTAMYCRANALQGTGKIQEANDIYMSMISKDRAYLTTSHETMYMVGENLRLMGRLSDAKIYLNSVRELPHKHMANISLGKIALDEGDIERAIKLFNSALQSRDRELRRKAILYLADAYMRAGKQDEAISNLKDIRNNYPYGRDYDSAILMLSRLYRSSGKTEEAISVLKELVFRRSPNIEAINEFERIAIDTVEKDREDILKLWKSIGNWLLDPSRSDSLIRISNGLRPTGKPFIDISKWLLKYGTEEAKLKSRIALADFYADIGDASSAREYLNSIENQGISKNDEALRVKAKVNFLNGDYQRAADAILSIKGIKESDINLLSEVISTVKYNRRAVEFYENAVNRLNAPVKAYIRLADILYDTGRKADAMKYYTSIISMKQTEISEEEMIWVNYRLSILSKGKDSDEAMGRATRGNSIVSRFAKVGLKEANIKEKLERLF